MSIQRKDFLEGISVLTILVAAALLCFDAFSSHVEWAWPGWVVLILVVAATIGLIAHFDERAYGALLLIPLVLFITDLGDLRYTNWFVANENNKDSQAFIDCTLDSQLAALVNDYNDLYNPDISMDGTVKVANVTQAECDTVKDRLNTILTKLTHPSETPVAQTTATPETPVVEETATATATSTTTAIVTAPVSTTMCRPINDYPTQYLPELSTSGQWILVEMTLDDGTEYEAILNASDAPGGRYIITNPFSGHAWEYGQGCSRSDVEDALTKRHDDRVAGGVNNKGTAPDEVVKRMLHPVGS